MPKITLNGREVEVKEGTTVIEAFKEHDENIAHYCWHPGLSIAGVCRLCMIEVEGNPRLQIACNTVVQDGMVVSNQSEKVKESVKWGLDFHLINHPLDCPICDQAGECGLQEQYMEYGKYTPEMSERKVKKRKVVDLGPTVVLDSERCILCSRCVRFTEEVTKTNELGIFNRGDRSEIGTFKDRPLDNKYSLNTVDICPVGALTSKDFRFRQRVWYLKEAETICTGCSTGCSVKGYFNEEGMWRVKPRYNEAVNGHWMCDEGRDTYKFVNKEVRLKEGLIKQGGQTSVKSPDEVAQLAGEMLKNQSSSVGLLITGQYTQEENQALLDFVTGDLDSKNIFHWKNNEASFEEFDGILLRGDRNPNTKGLMDLMAQKGASGSFADLQSKIFSGEIKTVIVAGPENQMVFNDIDVKIGALSKADNIVWMSAGLVPQLEGISSSVWQIPLKTYFEKAGTFINHAGLAQQVTACATFVPEALTIVEVVEQMKGKDLDLAARPEATGGMKTNHFTKQRGEL